MKPLGKMVSHHIGRTKVYLLLSECFPARMPVHDVRAWCLWRPEEGVRSPGTGVMRVVSCHVGVGK